jgi:hypothetical protein
MRGGFEMGKLALSRVFPVAANAELERVVRVTCEVRVDDAVVDTFRFDAVADIVTGEPPRVGDGQ